MNGEGGMDVPAASISSRHHHLDLSSAAVVQGKHTPTTWGEDSKSAPRRRPYRQQPAPQVSLDRAKEPTSAVIVVEVVIGRGVDSLSR